MIAALSVQGELHYHVPGFPQWEAAGALGGLDVSVHEVAWLWRELMCL